MDRRHFLAASGAGASTLLAGCTVDNPLAQIAGEGVLRDLGGVLQSAAVSGLGGTAGANNASRERLGPEANQAAFAAYGEVFNQIHRAPNPSTVVLPTAQVSLEQHTRAAIQHIDSLPDVISDTQMARVWDYMGPMVNHLNRPRQPANRRRPTDGAQSQVVVAQQQQNTSRLTIQPGQTARVVMTAHCADKTLPAFNRNHLITLRPAVQFFAGDRWGGMQMSLLRFFAANPGLVRHHDQQLMIWGLQGKEVNGSPFYFQALMRRNDLLQILEQAHPRAIADLQRAQATDEVSLHLQRLLQRNLPPEVRQLIGNHNIVSILSNPQEAPHFIERELVRMANMQPASSRDPAPGPDAAFSRLAAGVYAHTIGSGPLIATSTITNMGGTAFTFTLSEWVAETRTEHQRGMFTGFSRAQFFDHPVMQAWDQAQTAVNAAAAARRLGMRGLGAASIKFGYPAYDGLILAGRTLRKGKFGILLENPAARVLARYLPIIGNIHGAFEIFNPESTPPERVLAAFGVIPGLGNLIKITGNTKRLSALARWAANTTDGHRVFDVVQFLGDVDALGDWSDRLPDVGDMWRASHLLLDAAVSRMPHATSSAA